MPISYAGADYHSPRDVEAFPYTAEGQVAADFDRRIDNVVRTITQGDSGAGPSAAILERVVEFEQRALAACSAGDLGDVAAIASECEAWAEQVTADMATELGEYRSLNEDVQASTAQLSALHATIADALDERLSWEESELQAKLERNRRDRWNMDPGTYDVGTQIIAAVTAPIVAPIAIGMSLFEASNLKRALDRLGEERAAELEQKRARLPQLREAEHEAKARVEAAKGALSAFLATCRTIAPPSEPGKSADLQTLRAAVNPYLNTPEERRARVRIPRRRADDQVAQYRPEW